MIIDTILTPACDKDREPMAESEEDPANSILSAASCPAGSGAGNIWLSIQVQQVGQEVRREELAAGSWGFSDGAALVISNGATFGVTASALGAATVRLAGVPIPTWGGASIQCGEIVSKICQGFGPFEKCWDVITPITCGASAWGSLERVPYVVHIEVITELTNPAGGVCRDSVSTIQSVMDKAGIPPIQFPAVPHGPWDDLIGGS